MSLVGRLSGGTDQDMDSPLANKKSIRPSEFLEELTVVVNKQDQGLEVAGGGWKKTGACLCVQLPEISVRDHIASSR